MNFLRVFKLARAYNKARKLLKKNSPDVAKLQECGNNLRDLITELEESKLEFTNEIKKIKTVISELTAKISEEIK